MTGEGERKGGRKVLSPLLAVFICGTGLAALGGCSDSGPSSPSGFVDIGTNDPGTVLASGDSVTAGLDSSDGRGYRRHLEDLLNQQGKSVTVVNGGRAGIVSRNVDLVLSDLARFRPAVVVLQYGINDANVVAETTAPSIVVHLRNMVYGALDNKSIVVLTTLTPSCGYRDEQNGIIQETNRRIRELALEFEKDPAFVLADVGAAFAEGDPGGGGCRFISPANFNHPNDEGYRLMATVIAETMKPLSW